MKKENITKLIFIFNKFGKKHIYEARKIKKIKKIGYLKSSYLTRLIRIINLLQKYIKEDQIILKNGFYQNDLRKYPKLYFKK